MRQTVFFSGMYRSWNKARRVNVNKSCTKIVIRGIKHAMHNGKVTRVGVEISGKDYGVRIFNKIELQGDKLLLPEKLPRGTYYVNVNITYDDLEPAVYS